MKTLELTNEDLRTLQLILSFHEDDEFSNTPYTKRNWESLNDKVNPPPPAQTHMARTKKGKEVDLREIYSVEGGSLHWIVGPEGYAVRVFIPSE